jgi:hypothetical protein
MKEMTPGELTETMIWALCGKISDSVKISVPEMRELKTQNNNRYAAPKLPCPLGLSCIFLTIYTSRVDEKFFELFTEIASRKSTSRGMMGQRYLDTITLT